MTKVIQAFLSGALFTFILDFFLFLGVFLHYIKFYEIDLYYNILFADNQNIWIFLALSAFIGYLVIYTGAKTALLAIAPLFVITFSTLLPPIGKMAGEFLLSTKDTTLHTNRYSYHGDILYDGRKEVTFFDYQLKKVIILPKNKLKSFKESKI